MHSPDPVLPPRVRPQRTEPSTRRPRFSLRALLVTFTAIAVLLGAMIGLPPAVTYFLGNFILLAVFMSTLLGVIHGRGYLRTFCTGGLVASTYHLLPDLFASGGGNEMLLADLLESLVRRTGQSGLPPETGYAIAALARTLEVIGSAATLGLFSVWMRRRIERRARK